MPRKFAVIGLGIFGVRVALTLMENQGEVIAIDKNRKPIEEIKDKVTVAVRLDATDEEALKLQGIDKVDVAVVCIGEDFESNLLTTVLLKRLGVKKVVSRASSPVQRQILDLVGADRVVSPEEEIAVKLAESLALA
jgi:trk system potassium uptake protein TrkA